VNKKIAQIAAGVPILMVAAFALPRAQAPASSSSDTPVAWVNTQLILQQTPGYVDAESTFAAEMRGFQAEIQQLQAEMDSSIAEYQRQSLILSPTAKQETETALQQLQQTNQTRVNQLSQQAQRRERELVGPIEERVSAVIEGVRAERDIGIILDVAGGAGLIVAADRSLDLTPTIVQRLGNQ
jgi:Skp family chaperone for outer membrane proteins